MAEERSKRRLAAILAADVVGYSRLMQRDEAGTLAALKDRRKDILQPIVAKHDGRIVKLMGDGVLVEFGSAVDAVECATQLQEAMGARNASVPEGRQIVLRIGVNLGDVMVEGSDLYGDGVNIASRLEAIAEPGTVIVSHAVVSHVKGKTQLGFADLGERNLKNMPDPVRVYRVDGISGAGTDAAVGKTVLASKTSIVVLPFVNMSGDQEQEYFSDGITEDVITDLSKISALSIVARNTAFTFKGKAVDVAQVVRQLKVGYVLEGSVRKAGGRVRVTAQLIDGSKGDHVWAERYDRNLDDIFALQDEISKSIVDALKIQLLPEELETLTGRSTNNAQAYEVLLLGRHFFYQGQRTQTLKTARRLFAKAIEIDPGYARAYAGIADCDCQLLMLNDPSATIESILANSSRALELQPGLADAHASRGEALTTSGQRNEAEIEFERALKLDPNSFEAHFFYARHCRNWGRFGKAAALYERAAELRVADFRSLVQANTAYVSLGQLEKGSTALRQGLERIERELKIHPDNTDALCLGAAVLSELGETERAISWAARAALLVEDNPTDWYNLACFNVRVGRVDQAFDCLEKIATGTPEAFAEWMKSDPDMDPIRDSARYLATIARLEAGPPKRAGQG